MLNATLPVINTTKVLKLTESFKTRSEKGAGPNLLCIPPTMKCFLESSASPTPTNAEGLPNLPPRIEKGGQNNFQFCISSLKTTERREFY